MAIIALLMWTLVAVGNARIYERCELARTLSSLGVDKEHLATWVCIAYHESRYDTAARNPHSGDHGLLQISEIYWCGAGKACGIPCSALRDEDIADDIQCAHQIYKEHTRLQGDGFMAWVVYPHYCKHNAKKYLADCEGSLKDVSVREGNTARSLWSERRNVSIVNTYYPDIDKLKPPYLAINSLLETSLTKYDKGSSYWQNYKIDNIDSLKLPVFENDGVVQFISPPTARTAYKLTVTTTSKPTTTTIDPYLIGIKPPTPRKIESNQFRRKMKGSYKNQILSKDSSNIDSISMYSQNTSTFKQLINNPDYIEQYSITTSSDPYSVSRISISQTYDLQGMPKNVYLSDSNKNIPANALGIQEPINGPVTASPTKVNANNNYYEPFTPFYNRNAQNFQSNPPTSSAPKNDYFSRIEITTPKNLPINILYETKSKGLNGFDFSFKNLTEYTHTNMESDVPYKNKLSTDGPSSEFISSTRKVWPYTIQTTARPQTTTWSWRSTRPSSKPMTEVSTSSQKPIFFTTSNVSTIGPSWSSRRTISSSHLPRTTEPSTRSWRFSNQFFNDPASVPKTTIPPNHLTTTTTTARPWSWGFTRQTQRAPVSVVTTVPPNYLNWSSRKIVSELDVPKTTTPRLWSWGFSRQSQSTTISPKHYSVKSSSNSMQDLHWSSKKVTSELDSLKTIKPNSWSVPLTTTTTSNSFKTATYSPKYINEYKNMTSTKIFKKTSQPSTRSWRYVRPSSNNLTETTTTKPLSTTTSIYRWTTKKSTQISDISKISEVTKLQETSTTRKPSLFDLYLRPQKGSPYAPFQFSSFNSSRRFQIFAGGTTGSPSSHW